MITIYLKFADQATALANLPTFEGDDGTLRIPSDAIIDGQYCAIDVCFDTGVLMADTGETQVVEGFTLPVMAPIEGFHVNILSETAPPSLAAWIINPNSPDIVFG